MPKRWPRRKSTVYTPPERADDGTGPLRTELLRVKAAELGVSSAADIYIRKLERTGTATHTLGLKSAAARRELGVLAGELARGNFGALREVVSRSLTAPGGSSN